MEDPIAWSTISGYHSQLAGVLAGFMFAALTLLLSNPPEGRPVRDISDPLYLLLVVFFALIVSAFLYAVATGDKTPTGPVIANLFASFVFSLAAVQMFLCMAWMFAEYRVGPAALAGTHVLVQGVLLIAATHMSLTVGNTMVSLEHRDYRQDWHTLLWVAPVLALPLAGHFARRRHATHEAQLKTLRRLVGASMRFSIGCAVYCGFVLQTPEAQRPMVHPHWAKYLLMLMLGTLFFYCELSLPDAGPVSSDRKKHKR